MRPMKSLGQRLGFWIFLLSGGFLVHGFDPETEGMQGIKDLVRKRFPEVRQLQTAELAVWLSDTNRPQPVLLDVREVEEFAVSHLPSEERKTERKGQWCRINNCNRPTSCRVLLGGLSVISACPAPRPGRNYECVQPGRLDLSMGE